jgi:hypothetical protein
MANFRFGPKAGIPTCEIRKAANAAASPKSDQVF